MTRVLVTGATGFVGQHTLAPLLRRGHQVHAVSRHGPAPGAPAGVSWHGVDLLDPEETQALLLAVRPEALLHLAWFAEHGTFWSAPENLDWVAASAKLLRGFRELGGKRAVLAGTCAEYDWSGDCCDATTPLRPATLYGAAKDAFRRLAEAYAGATGLSAAWGRVFFTFGPGEQPTRVVASVARSLAAGEPAACTSGSQVRDFLYVEDLADAFAALLESRVTGALDLGSGEPLPLRDLLTRLAQRSGRPDLLRLGALPDRPEPARIVADTRVLRDEIGWTPARSLDEALDATVDWWRQREEHPDAFARLPPS